MSVVTEAELFAGYRVAAGYLAECGCGGWITAPSTATTKDIARVIRIHNESTDHRQWWENDQTHVQSAAWLSAGYEVLEVDLQAGHVRFSRVQR